MERVLSWKDEIHRLLEIFDLGDLVHVVDLLALIHVESAGDPFAHRAGSQFRGLLQIGRPYFIDAMQWLGSDAKDHTILHGDGESSIAVTLAYLCRYAAFHQWDPTLIATIHKGGIGTARLVRDQLIQGRPMHEALAAAEEALSVPRLQEYVRRFESSRAAYAKELLEPVRPTGVRI